MRKVFESDRALDTRQISQYLNIDSREIEAE